MLTMLESHFSKSVNWFLDRPPDLDHHQNEMGSSLSQTTSFHQVLWKSVQLVLCNLSYNSPERKNKRKGSLEMGLKLERTEGSRLSFFNKGCTTACLKAAGTLPERREVLINDIIHGPTVSKTSLRRLTVILSEGQFVGRRWWTTSERKDIDMGSNWPEIARGMRRIGCWWSADIVNDDLSSALQHRPRPSAATLYQQRSIRPDLR